MPVVTKEHNQCIVLAVSKMFSFFLKKKKILKKNGMGQVVKYWINIGSGIKTTLPQIMFYLQIMPSPTSSLIIQIYDYDLHVKIQLA